MRRHARASLALAFLLHYVLTEIGIIGNHSVDPAEIRRKKTCQIRNSSAGRHLRAATSTVVKQISGVNGRLTDSDISRKRRTDCYKAISSPIHRHVTTRLEAYICQERSCREE